MLAATLLPVQAYGGTNRPRLQTRAAMSAGWEWMELLSRLFRVTKEIFSWAESPSPQIVHSSVVWKVGREECRTERYNVTRRRIEQTANHQITSINAVGFPTKWDQFRAAVSLHTPWVQEQLGVPLSDCTFIESGLDIAGAATRQVVGLSGSSRSALARKVCRSVVAAAVPPNSSFLLEIQNFAALRDIDLMFARRSRVRGAAVHSSGCPLALKMRELETAIIAMNISYFDGPQSQTAAIAHVVVCGRDSASGVIGLIEEMSRQDEHPMLHTIGGRTQKIQTCSWDDLVLDPAAVSLLRDDFESFFEREQWFRLHHLPFRRGYLLHGPPGNGKSTAIRAMVSSRSLHAYSLRLFDPRIDDSDLADLFEQAANNCPALIMFEDLDRAFPRTGSSKSQISLQSLLNCLDGVATSEGIVVVATANEPTILDPAILRRPGRFDRVISFPKPNPELRAKFLEIKTGAARLSESETVLRESEGFSFAQLQEAFILAGQQAFSRGTDIDEIDLMYGIQMLRASNKLSSSRDTSPGFRSDKTQG